jgi:hypothetical protein
MPDDCAGWRVQPAPFQRESRPRLTRAAFEKNRSVADYFFFFFAGAAFFLAARSALAAAASAAFFFAAASFSDFAASAFTFGFPSGILGICFPSHVENTQKTGNESAGRDFL